MSRLDVPDCVFPSVGPLEIPKLRLDMQATFADLPVLQWGSRHGRRTKNRGTWHCYVDDHRFEALWTDPSRLPETDCINAVEPNVSVFEQTPMPFAIWATYRKRWIARYWQEQGIRIFVDLNVSRRHSRLNLLGVPRGWRAYATRGYADRPDDIAREHALACARRGSDDVLMMVVGPRCVRVVCEQLGCIYIPEPRRDSGDE